MQDRMDRLKADADVLQRFNPALPVTWLVFIAGALWTAVGIKLCLIAYDWLLPMESKDIMLTLTIGGLAAAVVMPLKFMKLARMNITRLDRYEGHVCVFAFQDWKSWILIAFMIALGWTLRNSGVSLMILTPVYIAIGVALIGSSTLYYARLFRK